MTVKYVVKQKVNPRNPEVPKELYGITKSTGNATLRMISKQLEKK